MSRTPKCKQWYDLLCVYFVIMLLVYGFVLSPKFPGPRSLGIQFILRFSYPVYAIVSRHLCTQSKVIDSILCTADHLLSTEFQHSLFISCNRSVSTYHIYTEISYILRGLSPKEVVGPSRV